MKYLFLSDLITKNFLDKTLNLTIHLTFNKTQNKSSFNVGL